MKCPKCGSEMNEKDRACLSCGNINPYNPENVNFISDYGTKEQKKIVNFGVIKRKNRRKKIIFIIVIIVLILLIYAAFYLTHK